jgi:hypothetical protein
MSRASAPTWSSSFSVRRAARQAVSDPVAVKVLTKGDPLPALRGLCHPIQIPLQITESYSGSLTCPNVHFQSSELTVTTAGVAPGRAG